MPFGTDQVLWYRNGAWGDLGYAVPNWGNDPTTMNRDIYELTVSMGRNLAGVLKRADVDVTTPPTINTILKIHGLIVRARSLMASRMVPDHKPQFEGVHVDPVQMDFLVYPVPFWRVRNPWLSSYTHLILSALSECYQHQENRNAYDFSERFAGTIGAYLHRIYQRIAVELFGVPALEAAALDFTLSEDVLRSYAPGRFFTSTELIDVRARLADVPTEDDLELLTNGIPASQIPPSMLGKWPAGTQHGMAATAATASQITGAAQANAANAASPSFAPAPLP